MRNEARQEDLLCPITQDIMLNPVETSDGHVYERQYIEDWLRDHDTSPMTGAQLKNKDLKEYQKLYDSLELELLGLELEPQDLKIWEQDIIELSQQVQLGFLLKNWNSKKNNEFFKETWLIRKRSLT